MSPRPRGNHGILIGMFESVVATAAGGPENQDRAAAIERPNALLLVVADGAGGLGGGAAAAELVIQSVRDAPAGEAELAEPRHWCELLAEADRMLCTHPSAGETAAVVAALTRDAVCGASVGDSGAILFQDSGEIDLTAHQQRKPLLGSGAALPVPFGPVPFAGTLLLASDGLLNYASRDALREIACARNAGDPAKALIESVRYPSGALPDDVTVIVCRPPR